LLHIGLPPVPTVVLDFKNHVELVLVLAHVESLRQRPFVPLESGLGEVLSTLDRVLWLHEAVSEGYSEVLISQTLRLGTRL
jgi:hypothetical protein